VPSGKALDHVSMYGTDLSDEENAEDMYRMFVNFPADVITPGVFMIHVEFSKFFRAEYFNANQLNEVDLWPYCVGFSNILSIFKIVVFGLLMSYQYW
jgi:hypothetical protein